MRKRALITGANTGIGKATAQQLASLGWEVIIACRDEHKARVAVDDIITATGNTKVDICIVDFALQSSIRKCAKNILDTYDRLDVLINNAGVLMPRQTYTDDSIEQTFAVNHIGYFLLTYLLLDNIKNTISPRIVNITSNAHFKGMIDFNNINLINNWNSWKAYYQSKLANVLFTYELSRRLEGAGVTVNCLHPGYVRSEFGRDHKKYQSLAQRQDHIRISCEESAQSVVYLAASPEVKDLSGYYYDQMRKTASSALSYDEDIARRLWAESIKLCNLTS